MDISTIVELVRQGGPTAMAAVFAAAWWYERREVRRLVSQIIRLIERDTQSRDQLRSAIDEALRHTDEEKH